MPPHDRLFKSLLRAFLSDLLRLVAPGVAERLRLGRVIFLDKELLAGDGRREADLVARIPLRDRGALLVHVEVEARARRSMPRRLRTYAHRIQTLYDTEEYKILSARNSGRKGDAMWMPWSERMKEEGRKEGIRLGQRKLLLHLLAQRFGPLPEAVRGQVEAITSTRRLTSLAGKVLTARSLHDLGFC